MYTEPPNPLLLERIKEEIKKWGFDLKKFKYYFENLETYKKYIYDSDFFITISDYTKKIIQEFYPKEVSKKSISYFLPVKNNFKPVLREYPDKFSKDRPLRLLIVANITLFKGLQYILEAIERLYKEKYYIQLTVVGTLDENIKFVLKKHFKDIIKKVRFEGFQKNVLPYYNNNDLFIFPSLTEGLPRSCIEAYSTSLPMIVTPVFPYIDNRKEGFIVKFQDNDDIYNKMKELYENADLLIKFNNNLYDKTKNSNVFDIKNFLVVGKRVKKEIYNVVGGKYEE